MKAAYLYILATLRWFVGGMMLIGFILEFVCQGDLKPNETVVAAVVISYLLIFSVLFLTGTALWVRAKGYSPALGVFLSWIGPLGLLILAILTNRNTGEARVVSPVNSERERQDRSSF